jgi:hypothetical protein
MTRSIYTRLTLSALLALALLIGAPAERSQAEVLRLQDGTILHGRIVEYALESPTFTFYNIRTGGETIFYWSQLDSADATRIRRLLGLEKGPADQSLKEIGVRVILFQGRPRIGLVHESSTKDTLVLRTKGGNVRQATPRSTYCF